MICTEAYKEHIEYTFNVFCRIVIRYAAVNAWRKRERQALNRDNKFDAEGIAEPRGHRLCPALKLFIPKQAHKDETAWGYRYQHK